jgi:hypothetical protein
MHETDKLGSGKKILLNAEDRAFVNNAVEVSNISEKYAPPERHLLYAVALAGEYNEDSSINGSMLSREKAAGAVIA